jgi:hypothetical protein
MQGISSATFFTVFWDGWRSGGVLGFVGVWWRVCFCGFYKNFGNRCGVYIIFMV